MTATEIQNWSLDEKLFVMEELWRGFSDCLEGADVPDEHRRILSERRELERRGKEEYFDLDDVCDEILNR